jgi:hypothetical protein
MDGVRLHEREAIMKQFVLATILIALCAPAPAQVALQPRWDPSKNRVDPGEAALAKRFQDAPWVDPDFHGYREPRRFGDGSMDELRRECAEHPEYCRGFVATPSTGGN